MIRRKRLSGGSIRKTDETPDPMGNLSNLADVMLVLACGLMAALVMYWKVDLSNSSVVVTEDNMEKIDVSEIVPQEGQLVLEGYQTKIVYEDPETGDLYVIDNEE